jgi:hypothetical protein
LLRIDAMPVMPYRSALAREGCPFLTIATTDCRLDLRGNWALPMRSKFDAEKFVAEAEAELKRLKDARQARRDAALNEIREKNWPRWLKYLVIGALRAAMLRNEHRHAILKPASAAWQAARKARDN